MRVYKTKTTEISENQQYNGKTIRFNLKLKNL